MQPSVENLCSLLVTSRLYAPEKVAAIRQGWEAEAKDFASVGQFLRWLVANQYVTAYQANQLSNGHVETLILGPYKLLERLGQGRMAGVFKAVHSSSGQVVAIKVLPLARAQDKQVLVRFQREARLAMQLHHPSVVRTFHVGESVGRHYLVMEYLEGDTLEALLKQRDYLPVPEAARIAFLASLALQHIHEKGMVHRDLKPANIMLCPSPGANENTLKCMVKLLDIGLGKELFDTKSKDKVEIREMTVQGFALGAPAYSAPEQTRDARTVDIRADIYSLGCTLFHALTGQAPFIDPNPVVLVLKHASEPPPPLTSLNPSIPEELNRIVLTMLAKDPNQRYRTPGHVADALKPFLPADTSDPSLAQLQSVRPELRNYLEWVKKEVATHQSSSEIDLYTTPATPVRGLSSKRLKKTSKPSLTPVSGVNLPALPEDPQIAPMGLPISRDVFMLLVGMFSILGLGALALLIWFLVTGGR
jgi:eukaryotic-like serine/threonine-protein kinase